MPSFLANRTSRSRARFNSLASVGNITAFGCTVVSITTRASSDGFIASVRVATARTIAPGLDCPVQVRHRRGRHPRPPQCLRDVLDPAHRIHLDQRLLHRALAPPIALDDRRLERLLAQLRYPQPYLASLGLQAALVVASAG